MEQRNFYNGQRIEELLFAGNSLAKAQRIFELTETVIAAVSSLRGPFVLY
jgi:hypothetical protein